MAFRVEILTEYCKGCELCVSACPKDVLEMSQEASPEGNYFASPKPGRECVGCLNCATMCPDAAIEVYEVAAAGEIQAAADK